LGNNGKTPKFGRFSAGVKWAFLGNVGETPKYRAFKRVKKF
jgi:hypothetical protein